MAGTKKSKKPATKSKPEKTASNAPAGLVQALAKVSGKLDKKFCYGLPHYERSDKHAFQLVPLGDLELFEENEVDAEEWPGWLPFAQLGSEAQFLAIHGEPPYRVGMWEHEDGKIHEVWPSLEDFAARVLASKREKTPYELLDKVLDKASALVDKDAHAKALELLEPAAATLPSVTATEDDEQLARLNNLWGLSLQGVGRIDDAFAAFERAAAAGEDYAQLNLMELLLEKKNDPQAALARARAMSAGYLSTYERTWVAIYTALASLALGDAATAEAQLRDLVARYAIRDAKMVTSAREKLEEYIAANRPNAEVARAFLAWLAPKSYADIPAAEAAANRAWWSPLHPKIRQALFKDVSLEGDPDRATDAQIAQCLDAEGCYVGNDRNDPIDDVTPFLRLHRAKRISFAGDPDTLEPLRALETLERVTINNTVIKYLAWPTRAQRALWTAASTGDQAGCEAALRVGADINGHHPDDFGNTAFHMAPAGEAGRAFALWLVEQGADPYAGTHGDSGNFPFEHWPDPAKARIAAAMAKFGHPPVDASPWREFSVGRIHRAASFEAPRFRIGKLGFDKGDSLAAVWPADATLQMEPPKTDDQILDVMNVKFDEAVVSEKVAEILRADPNIELLPVKLLAHDKQPVPGRWYFVNPRAKDCLIPEKCHFVWNHINPDSATELCSYAIDPAKVGDAQMFRPTILSSRPMIVTRALGEKLAALGYCVRISLLKR